MTPSGVPKCEILWRHGVNCPTCDWIVHHHTVLGPTKHHHQGWIGWWVWVNQKAKRCCRLKGESVGGYETMRFWALEPLCQRKKNGRSEEEEESRRRCAQLDETLANEGQRRLEGQRKGLQLQREEERGSAHGSWWTCRKKPCENQRLNTVSTYQSVCCVKHCGQ